MPLQFHTLDVFTDRRFGGNPLAVVHEADGLTSEKMQQIARELNLSETVFVLKADNPAHSTRALRRALFRRRIVRRFQKLAHHLGHDGTALA